MLETFYILAVRKSEKLVPHRQTQRIGIPAFHSCNNSTRRAQLKYKAADKITVAMFCDASFMHLLQCCPSIAICDIMQVERVLSLERMRISAASDMTDLGNSHNDIELLDISSTAEGSTQKGMNPDAAFVSSNDRKEHSPPCQDAEKSRMGDYLYYNLDLNEELRCGPLFGAVEGSISSVKGAFTPPSGKRIDILDRNARAVKKTAFVPKPAQWKLDICANSGDNNNCKNYDKCNSSGSGLNIDHMCLVSGLMTAASLTP